MGQTQQFVPGPGFKVGGRIIAPWVGGEGRGVAYGLVSQHGNMWGPTGSNWIDPNGTTVTLSLNEPGIYKRDFIVAADLAEVSGNVFKDAHVVNVSVLEAESRRGATGVAVTVKSSGKSVTQARSREGKVALKLPAGRYTLSPHDTVRTAVTTETVIDVPQSASAPVELLVSSPAVAVFQVGENGGATAIPCKLRFMGRNGTPDPDLGPAHEIITRNVVYLKDGLGRVSMPAGDYDIVITRGIEYHMALLPVSLKRNIETAIYVQLTRAFDKGNYLGGDLHQHMKNSFDSAIPLEHRVINSAGEGLDFAVATDHNFVTDLRPVVAKLNLDKWFFAIVGNEITTRKHFFGHFNAFPLVAAPGKPNNGATGFEGVTAAQLFQSAGEAPGDQVIQVNHPRSSDIGYFNQVYMSRDDGVTTHLNWSDRFTAIEVFNGKRVDEFQDSFPDWCNLLNMGYSFTGTGNSDSHRVFDQEPGFPRTYVKPADKNLRGEQRVEAIVNVLNKTHAAFVSNGPFIEFSLVSPRADIGQTVSSKGPLQFECRVLGADFVQPSVLEFYGNGKLINSTEFEETSESVKFQTSLDDEPTSDTWYVVVVRGKHSLYPVVNPLVEGSSVEQVLPLAFTNPIWVDRDGDGKFQAVHHSLFEKMHADRSAEALAQIDTLTSKSQDRNAFRRARRPSIE